MEVVKNKRVYELYEIFKDYNRIIILTSLFKNELTIEDLSIKTGISVPVLYHQLEYLISFNIVSKSSYDETFKYKISDKTMNKIIDYMINYVEHEKRTRTI